MPTSDRSCHQLASPQAIGLTEIRMEGASNASVHPGCSRRTAIATLGIALRVLPQVGIDLAEMLESILIVVGVLLFAALIVRIVFSIGMRGKTPWVLDGVRRFARAVGNPLQMRKAGAPGAYASVIRHEGRRSGKSYATPVAAEPTNDGFVIAMVYGPNTDWLKNVLAGGSATIEHEGRTYPVDRPEIVLLEDVEEAFGPKELRTLHRYRVTQCLRVRRVEPLGEEAVEHVEPEVSVRARTPRAASTRPH
jgi:deazaflavin-dependent oxidoreductase (nitroreductase family)